MKKKWLISKDSEYYKDEEVIKLESCPDGGQLCKSQMTYMNENLRLARTFIDNKEYIRAVELIRNSFDSTFQLKEKKCQACAELFRESISDTLHHLIIDLEDMTKGFFGNKSFKTDLAIAKNLLQEIKDKVKS